MAHLFWPCPLGPWGGTKKLNNSKGSIFFSKFNQRNLMCELPHINAMCNSTIFGSPSTEAMGRGQKVKYHNKVNFKDILKKTLCVFSQMKDINIIILDEIFIQSPWSCPSGRVKYGIF